MCFGSLPKSLYGKPRVLLSLGACFTAQRRAVSFSLPSLISSFFHFLAPSLLTSCCVQGCLDPSFSPKFCPLFKCTRPRGVHVSLQIRGNLCIRLEPLRPLPLWRKPSRCLVHLPRQTKAGGLTFPGRIHVRKAGPQRRRRRQM